MRGCRQAGRRWGDRLAQAPPCWKSSAGCWRCSAGWEDERRVEGALPGRSPGRFVAPLPPTRRPDVPHLRTRPGAPAGLQVPPRPAAARLPARAHLLRAVLARLQAAAGDCGAGAACGAARRRTRRRPAAAVRARRRKRRRRRKRGSRRRAWSRRGARRRRGGRQGSRRGGRRPRPRQGWRCGTRPWARPRLTPPTTHHLLYSSVHSVQLNTASSIFDPAQPSALARSGNSTFHARLSSQRQQHRAGTLYRRRPLPPPP